MRAAILSIVIAAILAGVVWFPAGFGQCGKLVGHNHGHGKPIIVCQAPPPGLR